MSDKPTLGRIRLAYSTAQSHQILCFIALLKTEVDEASDQLINIFTGLCSTVGKESDYRSRGREFDPGASHTFVEIDHEIISTAILLPLADSRRVVVSYKRKYVHEVLINCLFKLAQEKSVVRSIDRPYMTIAVDWEVKH